MRVTPPSLRRRNGALLKIGSHEKWLARRDGDEVHDEEGDDHTDGDISDSDSDSDSDDEPAATQPSGSAPTGGVGVITLPPTDNAAAIPGVTLGADEGTVDDDSDSDDEENETTTAPPAAGTTSTAVGPPPATITSSASSSLTSSDPALPPFTSGAVPVASDTSSIDIVSTASQSVAPTTLQTLSPGPSLTVPAAGGAQQSDEPALPETIAVPLQQSNAMTGGAAAGIVIGVLAIIGVMVGAAFLWRKYRRGCGLPFLPVALPFRKRRDSNDPYSDNAAFATPNGNPKTNTKIMDELMRAAYNSENGGNDMAGAGFYGTNEKQSAWLDEKAFAALGGEPTPRRTSKPVNRWLSAIDTPRQSRPGFPPSERMSTQSATRFPIRLSQSPPRDPNAPQANGGMRPPMPGTMAGDRLEPPKPAYNARETMTTDTTSTSVRWYG